MIAEVVTMAMKATERGMQMDEGDMADVEEAQSAETKIRD